MTGFGLGEVADRVEPVPPVISNWPCRGFAIMAWFGLGFDRLISFWLIRWLNSLRFSVQVRQQLRLIVVGIITHHRPGDHQDSSGQGHRCLLAANLFAAVRKKRKKRERNGDRSNKSPLLDLSPFVARLSCVCRPFIRRRLVATRSFVNEIPFQDPIFQVFQSMKQCK